MQKHMPKRGTVWKEAAMKRMGVMLAVVLALGQKFAYLLEGFLRLAVDGNPPSHPQAGGSVPAAVPSSARRPEPQRHGAGEGPGLLYCRQKPTPDHGGAPLGTPGAKP
jgi:hypothetical protein